MWSCGLSTHKSQNQRPYGTPGPDLASWLVCELHAVANGHPLWLRPQWAVLGVRICAPR